MLYDATLNIWKSKLGFALIVLCVRGYVGAVIATD